MTYFTVRGGRAAVAPTLHGLAGGCWDDYDEVVIARSHRYVIEDAEMVGDRARRLRVSRFDGQGMGPVCTIDETHTVKLVAHYAACAPNIPCGAYQAAALSAARVRQIARKANLPATAVATVDPYKVSDRLPKLGEPLPNGETAMFDTQTTSALIDGRPVRLTVGGGAVGWRIYPGWLVRIDSVGGAAGKQPLAAFQFARVPDRVVSVRSWQE